jgi:hypothetical protein
MIEALHVFELHSAGPRVLQSTSVVEVKRGLERGFAAGADFKNRHRWTRVRLAACLWHVMVPHQLTIVPSPARAPWGTRAFVNP